MLFLVYSPLSSSNIEHSLGMADYSYYFVMQRFLPLLREFGEVRILEQTPTDEEIAAYRDAGKCIYLSFTPPNKVAQLSGCPVVPVFAWEYSTIPDEQFNCSQDNWVHMLMSSGSAITHSRYAREVVRSQLGADYPIESIPAPIWDSYQHIRRARAAAPPQGIEGLNLDCTIIDSTDYLISNTSIRPLQNVADNPRRLLSERWDGAALQFNLARGQHELTLIGFNDAESWGVWSRSGYPWILFDCAIDGEIELSVTVRGYMQNIGKPLRIEMGSESADLLLSETLQTHTFRMSLEQPTNVMAFVGLAERITGSTDPRDIGMGLAGISIVRPAEPVLPTDSIVVDLLSNDLVCEGLYEPEAHGRWTSSDDVSIQLPASVAGDFCLRVEVFHLQHNHQRQIELRLGESRQLVTLQDGRTLYDIDFKDVRPTDYLCFLGLGSGPSENPDDPRILGLGLAGLALHGKEPPATRRYAERITRTLLQWSSMLNVFRGFRAPRNILYTAIFNPKDGRKNWGDIITGFVYAFRDDAAATLLIKITYHDLGELYEDIFTYLIELHPFKCRLVFIHGYLTDEQYEQLLLHSHYIVNASRGEGQCLPLMEFMSAGVPAVAPNNTAMAEYISVDNAFIVDSSPDITFWPHDPRQVFRTLWQRINWESLVAAYTGSARVWRKMPRTYQRMSEAAADSQQNYCSMETARTRLQRVLDGFPENDGQ